MLPGGLKIKNQCRSVSSRETIMSQGRNTFGVVPPPTGGIKLTITNIDAGLGEEGIKELLNQKIRKTCLIQR
jgi:hypothetical protein